MNPHPNSHQAELSEQAMHALGLHSQPFSERPAGHEYYSDPVIQMQLNMLQHNLKCSDMLQVLKGGTGSGKTALIIQMLATTNDALQIFVARGTATLSAAQIIGGMLKIFQQAMPADTNTCIDLLIEHLKARRDKNRSSVLVIENAHKISVPALNQVLTHADTINEALDGELRLLLVADPAIESIIPSLTSKQLREGKLFISSVRALDKQRIGDYVEHRLQIAGFSGELPFSRKQLAELHKNTAGIPQKVDAVAARVLNQQASKPALNIEVEKIPLRPVGGFAVSAIALSLLFFLFTDDADNSVATATTADASTAGKTVTVVLEPTLIGNTENAAAELPKPTVVSEVVRVEPETPPRIAAQTTANDTVEKSRTAAFSNKEKWLLAQQPEHYTIQLLASYDKQALLRYAKANNIESTTALFETVRNQRRWYVLTFGLYSGVSAARAALAKLPEQLRRNTPWVRPIKSIKQAIKRKRS